MESYRSKGKLRLKTIYLVKEINHISGDLVIVGIVSAFETHGQATNERNKMNACNKCATKRYIVEPLQYREKEE